jgi:hypothetical protein
MINKIVKLLGSKQPEAEFPIAAFTNPPGAGFNNWINYCMAMRRKNILKIKQRNRKRG